MSVKVLCWTLCATMVVGLMGTTAVGAEGDEETWGAVNVPTAFITHLAADPDTPDFMIAIIAQAVARNDDRTQASAGALQKSWALYYSSDGGEGWQPASNDLAHVEPTMLEITKGMGNSIVWVGTARDGLWRSENGARTWRPVSIADLEDQRVLALVVDARERLHLLTVDNSGFPDSHLYTSVDHGYSWSHRLLQPYNSNPATLATDLVADPFDANTLYAPTFGGLLVSNDAGFTWRQASIPLPKSVFTGNETALAADPTQRGRLFLLMRSASPEGGEQTSVYRSLDSAQTWEMLPAQFTFPTASRTDASLRPLRLEQDPINRRQLFLATNNGLWLSDDAGLNWRLAGSALAGLAVSDFYIHPRRRGRWIVAGAGGLWQTANGGSQWRMITTGAPAASNLESVVASADGEMLFALSGGFMPIPAGRHPLWRSADGGETWALAMRGLEDVQLRRLFAHPQDAAMVYATATNGVARTDNSGRSWQYTATPFDPLDLTISGESGHVFAASADGVWRSNDKGRSWALTELTGPAQAVAIAADGAALAVLGDDAGAGTLWRSEDDGRSWQAVGATPLGLVTSLVSHPDVRDTLALTVAWGGLYLSDDGGRAWRRRDEGIPAGTRLHNGVPETPEGPNLLDLFIESGHPARWWTSRDGGGVYRSEDGGRTWTDASADLGDNLIYQFAFNKGRLVAGASKLGLLERRPIALSQEPPAEVDVRIEILWPHGFTPVAEADLANLGLRVYKGRSQEAPPCAWTPTVEVWAARDAEPLRRLGFASQRTIDGHPFPFWEYNDVDVSWANDPEHKLVFLARVSPNLADSQANAWVHAADARTYLPEPPQPTGLTTAAPETIDALIRVVWPHDRAGNFTPPEQATLVNISAVLVEKDTSLALRPEQLPARVWLIGALDNQVGRRLAVGEPRAAQAGDLVYTAYEFNNIDVSLARDPQHRWTFWLEVPDANASSNVWVHGIDSRTWAPALLEPISGCQP